MAGLAGLAAMSSIPDLTGRRRLGTVGLVGLGAVIVASHPMEPGLGLVTGVAVLALLVHLWGHRTTREPLPVNAPALVVAALVVVFADMPPVLRWASLAVLGVHLAGTAWLGGIPRIRVDDVLEHMLSSPVRLLVTSFLAVAGVGSVLLALPLSARTAPVGLLDAAFTSVSATCVTGLIVVDTPTVYSTFGQVVLLGLIQVGGLGIMVFAATASVILGRRLGLRAESVAAEIIGLGARQDLERAVLRVVALTFATEALGAALLTPLFVAHGDTPGEATWRAVFTSVSALCNAGFALQSDSLVPYAGSPLVLLVVGAVIVVGGLGPLVVSEIPLLTRGRGSLHTRVALTVTAALLVIPTVLLLALEWDRTLTGPWVDRVANAAFQAVTLRTSGFNSIDLTAVAPATWTLMIACMFVGGSPGSTAGGVKTTTVGVLLLASYAAVRGRDRIEAFGREITPR
ncbi:MAG: hypothetical protein KC656_23485, partial [Myxococcales bacterium]|nr:hypothetical protein [Myxococcales bacterium]